MENTEDNKIKNPINLTKLPLNKEVKISLTKENSWVHELIDEIHEGVTGMPTTELFKRTVFDLEMSLTKKFKNTMGEYLLVKIKMHAVFFTNCVKTLALMKDQLDLNFQSCIVSRTLEENEEFMEQIEVFMDNEMYDLHFYDKNAVDVKEVIHEQIYLNKNPYPTRDGQKDAPNNTSGQF